MDTAAIAAIRQECRDFLTEASAFRQEEIETICSSEIKSVNEFSYRYHHAQTLQADTKLPADEIVRRCSTRHEECKADPKPKLPPSPQAAPSTISVFAPPRVAGGVKTQEQADATASCASGADTKTNLDSDGIVLLCLGVLTQEEADARVSCAVRVGGETTLESSAVVLLCNGGKGSD